MYININIKYDDKSEKKLRNYLFFTNYLPCITCACFHKHISDMVASFDITRPCISSSQLKVEKNNKTNIHRYTKSKIIIIKKINSKRKLALKIHFERMIHTPFYRASILAASAGMSRAFNFVKGLSILSKLKTTFPSTVTTKLPLPGFSGFIVTSIPPARSALAKFSALVLNAPQLLHASMVTFLAEEVDSAALVALGLLVFLLSSGSAETSAFLFGGMV